MSSHRKRMSGRAAAIRSKLWRNSLQVSHQAAQRQTTRSESCLPWAESGEARSDAVVRTGMVETCRSPGPRHTGGEDSLPARVFRPFGQSARRQRLAHVVSLAGVAAERCESLPQLFALDAFGDRLKIQAVRELDGGAHDGRRILIAGHAAHEAL